MTSDTLARRVAACGAALAAVTILAAAPAHADNQNRRVRIINETDHVMVHFYASNVARKTWEEDILGREVLRPGEDSVINIDDGTGHCMFDFKAVFDDGESLVRHEINVCKISSYRYSE